MPPTIPTHINLTQASSQEAEWPVDAAVFELPHDLPCHVTVSRTAAGSRPRYVFVNETEPVDGVPDTDVLESWDFVRRMEDGDTRSALSDVASAEGAALLEGGHAQVIVRENEAKPKSSQAASDSATLLDGAPSTVTAVDAMSMNEGHMEHQPDPLDEPSQVEIHHRLVLELPLDRAVGELRLKSEGTLSLRSADRLVARLLSVVAAKNFGLWPDLEVDELHVDLKDDELDCGRLLAKRFDIVAERASVRLSTDFPVRGGQHQNHCRQSGSDNLGQAGDAARR